MARHTVQVFSKTLVISAICIALLLAALPVPVSAGAVCMAAPSSADFAAHTEAARAALEASTERFGNCYAVSAAQELNDGRFALSLVGLDTSIEGGDWSMANVVWLGFAIVDPPQTTEGGISVMGSAPQSPSAPFDNVPEPGDKYLLPPGVDAPTATQLAARTASVEALIDANLVLPSQVRSAGVTASNVDVIFPWEAGGSMAFGHDGVFDATTGPAYLQAVAFTSEFAASAANMGYYAYNGTVVWNCVDDTTWAVFVNGPSLGQDDFLYGGFDKLYLSQPPIGTSVRAGDDINRMTTGSYTGRCGDSDMETDDWQIVFGFYNGTIPRFDGYTLDSVAHEFVCGSTHIVPGDLLTARWSSNNCSADLPEQDFGNIWDPVVAGLERAARGIRNTMPIHTYYGLASQTNDIFPLAVTWLAMLIPYNMSSAIFVISTILLAEIGMRVFVALGWIRRILPW